MAYWWIPMAIGAAAEYAKGQDAKKQAQISQSQAKAQNQYNAELMRVSPWTGINPGTTLQYGQQAPSNTSQFLGMAGGALAGANAAQQMGLFDKDKAATAQFDPGVQTQATPGGNYVGPIDAPVAQQPIGQQPISQAEWMRLQGFTGPYGG